MLISLLVWPSARKSDCTAVYFTNTIIKFADVPTALRLFFDNNETQNKEEIGRLSDWCTDHYLTFNIRTAKEVVLVWGTQDVYQQGSQNHLQDTPLHSGTAFTTELNNTSQSVQQMGPLVQYCPHSPLLMCFDVYFRIWLKWLCT